MSLSIDGYTIMIVILIGVMIAYGWNRDHRAPGMAEAVVAHRTVDKPADPHMLLRADDEQRRSGGLGCQNGPRLAGEELQSPAEPWPDGVEYRRDHFAVRWIQRGRLHRHIDSSHSESQVEIRGYIDCM
jgi:hypothetical protein